MNAKELDQILTRTGVGPTLLADRTGYTRQGVEQWRRGRVSVPEPIAAWLTQLAEWLDENPPPQR